MYGPPPLVSRVEVLEGTAYLRRCLWSLGCQARRAPQDFCTVGNPEARDEPDFKCRFSFSNYLFCLLCKLFWSRGWSAGRSVVLSGARAGLWCFLARHARAWVKNLTCITSNQKTTPFFKTSCILHLFIIYLRYNITCIPICIYCLLILVFILKQAVTW